MNDFCRILSGEAGRSDFRSVLADSLPECSVTRVVLKPNWVCHQSDPAFPIEALVTSTQVIEMVLEACLTKYPELQRVLIGDIPIQSCDWDALARQARIGELIRKYEGRKRPEVLVRDLRRERIRSSDGFLSAERAKGVHGDPLGYSDVILDRESFLEEISDARSTFRISDYSPEEMSSSHRRGVHRYQVSRSLLDCDLFINIPKMKTHQKAGITGALKNLVGINGNKAFLVHYRLGKPDRGGDEFPADVPWPVLVQARVHQWARGKSRFAFRALQRAWRGFRRAYGMEVRATRENLSRPFVLAPGSWWGNDSIWRMVYDLNRVIQHAKPDGGPLDALKQRHYLAVLDGLIAGEGNGPLQPLPVETGVLAVSNNPFLIDFAMARLMGFDSSAIPLLSRHRRFGAGSWGDFDPETVTYEIDGSPVRGTQSLPILHDFLSPPGWRGTIELGRERKAS